MSKLNFNGTRREMLIDINVYICLFRYINLHFDLIIFTKTFLYILLLKHSHIPLKHMLQLLFLI